jgi:hypothetical protein
MRRMRRTAWAGLRSCWRWAAACGQRAMWLARACCSLANVCSLARGAVMGICAMSQAHRASACGPRCTYSSQLASRIEALHQSSNLLQAAVDMARVPDEYLISPTYNQVTWVVTVFASWWCACSAAVAASTRCAEQQLWAPFEQQASICRGSTPLTVSLPG